MFEHLSPPKFNTIKKNECCCVLVFQIIAILILLTILYIQYKNKNIDHEDHD